MAATTAATISWGEASGEESTANAAMASPGTNSGHIITTKLLTRPKTTSGAARRTPTLQYVYGSKCSIQVLGEKMYNPQPQPQQPQPQERPKTSVQRSRGGDGGSRPGTSSNRENRSGYFALQSKEVPLPICTTRESGVRTPNSATASATDKEILSITAGLRNRSAIGGRSMASVLGSSSRDRSAALLKELSMSFSLPSCLSKMGPTSPFKDCLRERWSAISKESSLYNASAAASGREKESSLYNASAAASGRERTLSPVRSVSHQDSNDDVQSTAPSADDSQHGTANRGHKTERSRALSYFKDLKETWNRSNSPSKDSSEGSGRKSASSVKDTMTRGRHAATAKRVRSSGNLLNFEVAGTSDMWPGNKTPKKDMIGKEMVLTSPRVITINRIPSARVTESGRKAARADSKMAADSATKCASSKTSTPSPLTLTTNSGETADRLATASPTTAAAATPPPPPHDSQYQPGGRSRDRLQQVQQQWDDTSLQGEAPCNVTSFDMTISPVKECSSPRARAASFLSDRSGHLSLSCVRPVSVREDAVLTLCASLCGQPATLPEDSAQATDHHGGGASRQRKEGDPSNIEGEPPTGPPARQRDTAQHILLQGVGCAAMPHTTAEDIIITQQQHQHRHSSTPEGTAARKCVSTEETDTNLLHVNSAATPTSPTLRSEQASPVPRLSQEEVTALLKGKTLDGHSPLLLEERSYSVFHQEHTSLVSARTAAGGGGGTYEAEGLEFEDNEEINGFSAATDSSSSTPTVPFSGSDLLYGNGEGTGRGSQGVMDEVAAGDVGAWEQGQQRGGLGDKQKLKELDLHGNKRPASRNSTSRKVPSYDKVAYDRDREELRPIANSLPPSKQSPLRANGLKNNLLRADQFLPQRSNGTSGRDEDLVAMGTLWSPGQLQTRGSSTATTTTSSGKSTSAPNSGSYNATSGTLPVRRPINLSTSTSTRQLLHHATNATSTLNGPNMGNCVAKAKEVEPKYSDPLVGATPTFQQRLMELAALEAETVRWERTKKVKKKPKQDRDS